MNIKSVKGISVRRKKYWLANVIMFYVLKLNFWRDEKIWVYGCWESSRYDDNSKYLFEYMNENHPEIRSVWLSNDSAVVEKVRSLGYEGYVSNSKEGMKIQLKAGVYFYTNGVDDIATVPFIYGSKVIGLWHGTGMKNVYYKQNGQKRTFLHKILKKIKDKIFVYTYQDYAISTSSLVSKMRAETYQLKQDQMIITGQPRNDVFKQELLPSQVFKMLNNADNYRYILYMPTYRSYDDSTVEDFVGELMKSEKLKDIFVKNNIRFILKLHYLTQIDKSLVSDPFYIISNDDVDTVQELLAVSDCMITDYSGCCIDFALRNKTILLYSPDYEIYNQKQGLKDEWIEIYKEKGLKDAQEAIEKLCELIKNNSNDLDISNIINGMYESSEIEGTVYSENVYNAVLKLLKHK